MINDDGMVSPYYAHLRGRPTWLYKVVVLVSQADNFKYKLKNSTHIKSENLLSFNKMVVVVKEIGNGEMSTRWCAQII